MILLPKLSGYFRQKHGFRLKCLGWLQGPTVLFSLSPCSDPLSLCLLRVIFWINVPQHKSWSCSWSPETHCLVSDSSGESEGSLCTAILGWLKGKPPFSVYNRTARRHIDMCRSKSVSSRDRLPCQTRGPPPAGLSPLRVRVGEAQPTETHSPLSWAARTSVLGRRGLEFTLPSLCLWTR